jgi:hypothetical protein
VRFQQTGEGIAEVVFPLTVVSGSDSIPNKSSDFSAMLLAGFALLFGIGAGFFVRPMFIRS